MVPPAVPRSHSLLDRPDAGGQWHDGVVDRRGLVVLGVGVALALPACGRNAARSPSGPFAPDTLTVTSSAFTEGATISAEFTCAGRGRRPPLAWSGDLHGAKVLAVVVDDPDAPRGTFYHWVVVDLPIGTARIGEGAPPGGREIRNSAGAASWTPPCPPSGTHHYRFTVYGLSAPTGLRGNASISDVLSAIQKTAVVQGRLTGLVSAG